MCKSGGTMKFKDVLKKLRKESKTTQAELAAELNYGSSAISNYEKGYNEPSYSDLIKIAVYFDVSLDFLLTGNDKKDVIRHSAERLMDEDFEKVMEYIEFLKWKNEAR